MKLLVPLAILLASASASKASITNVQMSTVDSVLTSIKNGAASDENADLDDFLSKTWVNAGDNFSALKKFLKGIKPATAKYLINKKSGSGHLLALPIECLKDVDTNTLKSLFEKQLKLGEAKQLPLDFDNIPVKHFENADFVKSLLDNLEDGKTTHGGYSATKSYEEFLAYLTKEQLQMVVRKCPDFHGGLLTGAALNHLATKDKFKLLPVVNGKFMDTLTTKSTVHIKPEVYKHLSENILTEIVNKLSPEDAKSFTKAQLKAIVKNQADLDFSLLPISMVEHLPANGDFLRGELKLSSDQISAFILSQWTAVLDKVEGYELLAKPDVALKAIAISSLPVTAEGFAKINPVLQAYIIANHTALPVEILCRVDYDQSKGWEYKDKSGLDVLQFIKNPASIKQLGTHSEVSKNPLSEMTFADVDKIPILARNLPPKAIESMSSSDPSDLAELKKYAKYYATKDSVYELLTAYNPSEEEKSKPNVFESMTKEFLADLTLSEESRFMEFVKLEDFDKFKVEILSVIPGHAVAQFKFLSKLLKEKIEALGDAALTHIGSEHKDAIRLVDIREAQVPSLGVAATTSILAVAKAADVAAMGKAKILKLQAEQMAILPAATVAAIFTPEIIPEVQDVVLTKMTLEQFKTMSPAAVGAFTADQIKSFGRDVADLKKSAASFFIQHLDKLSDTARAALFIRFPGSAAPSAAAVSVLIASVGASLAMLL